MLAVHITEEYRLDMSFLALLLPLGSMLFPLQQNMSVAFMISYEAGPLGERKVTQSQIRLFISFAGSKTRVGGSTSDRSIDLPGQSTSS